MATATDLVADEKRLMGDLRRLGGLVARHRAGADDPALRLALIDELLQLRRRLRTARDGVAVLLRRTAAARTATSAYGRVGALRR
ncbi:hypothetical protein [Azospirillum sp. ST 5-10]|uniref:hypothetical protein n=1 Tax=unclassified Azospirillum TaxID=2630922 RepID=UPI003F4A2339